MLDNIFTDENYRKMTDRLQELKNSEYAKTIAKRYERFVDYSKDEKEMMTKSSELFIKNFRIN